MALEGVITSDWHLTGMYKPLGARAPELQFAEINKVYNHATANGLDKVFVPGDLCDSPVMDEENFIRLLTHLIMWDSEVETYYMRGNHDVEHKFKTSLDVLNVLVEGGMFKRLRILNQAETLKIDGVNVSFLPWPSFEAPEAKDGRGRLIFAHIETAGAIGDNGRKLKGGNEDKVIRSANDYIVSGHIHQYQEMKKKRLTYVGTLYQKNFGESLPKGFLEFKAGYKKGDDKLQFKHSFIDSKPNFILENLVIKDQADWDKIKKDPNIRYKLFVDRTAGILVPKNLTQMYPNIVHITGVNTASMSIEEVVEAARGASAQVGDLPKFNPTTGLKSFLKREGVTDKAAHKKARSLVREAMAHVEAQRVAKEA